MPVLLAFSIVAVSITAIMYKTYVGYGEYAWYTKIGVILFSALSLCGPIINYNLRNNVLWNKIPYINQTLYFLFGFIFFLFILTLLRDIIWMFVDLIRHTSLDDMKDTNLLQKANVLTIIFCLFFCIYGVYEANKDAAIVTYEIASSKIKKPTKLVMLSDLHINSDVSPKHVRHLVDRINNLHPDVIALVGDIVDDTPAKLYKQMEELKNLKAKDNTYVALGNHEFYIDGLGWGIKFGQMGFQFLCNYGMTVENAGIYIGGIPDINAGKLGGFSVKVKNALHFAKKDDYVIMLSHTPQIVEGITKENVDLQLSGHTHGGQIYPFHYLAKQSNDGHLAGFYDVNGVKLYVSRGAGYWGPPMRIFAPSEIAVFNLIPEKTNNAK